MLSRSLPIKKEVMQMPSTLLFDDVTDNHAEIIKAYKASGGDFIIPFDAETPLPESYSYERHIENQLVELMQEGTQLDLIACDKELGEYENYRGLSANAVASVARNLGLPFCQYSRGFGSAVRELERFVQLRRWDSEEITLFGSNPTEWGNEIAGFADGFSEIKQAYEYAGITELTPEQALASIMGREDASSKIALYGSGDQSVMTEIFAFLHDEKGSVSIAERMPRIIGTWLWVSVLRFPGVLVNQTSAASLLNIDNEDFSKESVQKPFESAKYEGPFAKLGNWWWREDLEGLVLDAEVEDGRALLASKQVTVEPCLNAAGEPAGYYCMITESPVGYADSVGNINWFPSGADLSRIRKDKYEEITSLIRI
jgi:hypothetical protein